MDNEFDGIWVIDPEDRAAVSIYGNISFEFSNGHNLTCNIYEDGKVQKIFLIYKVQNDVIITDQPSSPQVEKTKFKFLDDGKLMLAFNGVESIFIKKQGSVSK